MSVDLVRGAEDDRLSHRAEITVQRFVRTWDKHLQGAHELLVQPQQGHHKAYGFQPTYTPNVCWPGKEAWASMSAADCVYMSVCVHVCMYMYVYVCV